jgi:hypothetical protein
LKELGQRCRVGRSLALADGRSLALAVCRIASLADGRSLRSLFNSDRQGAVNSDRQGAAIKRAQASGHHATVREHPERHLHSLQLTWRIS